MKASSHGVKRDIRACNAMVRVLASHGHFDDALNLVNSLGAVESEADLATLTE